MNESMNEAIERVLFFNPVQFDMLFWWQNISCVIIYQSTRNETKIPSMFQFAVLNEHKSSVFKTVAKQWRMV